MTESGDETFVDGLYEYLLRNGDSKSASEIQTIMETEEYDTDSLETDILLYQKYSNCNMEALIENRVNFTLLFDYIYDLKCMS